MKLISQNDIPRYLRKGDFYKALDEEDNGTFEVPGDSVKENLDIESDLDLNHALRSLRFWGVVDMQVEIFSYVMKNFDKARLEGLAGEFPEFRTFFSSVVLLKEDPSDTVRRALHMGLGLRVIKFLHEQMGYELQPLHSVAAAGHDDWQSMIYIQDKLGSMHHQCLLAVAVNGSMKCLRYAFEQGWQISEDVFRTAGQYGQLAVVKFLHEVYKKPYPADMMLYCAIAAVNPVAMLRYLHETECPWDANACAEFALRDYFDCLVYAYEAGCPWNAYACRCAALAGHFRCLEYLHTHGCPWNETTTTCATANSHFDCLVYAHQRGCPLARQVDNIAIQNDAWKCFWYIVKHKRLSSDLLSAIFSILVLSGYLALVCYTREFSLRIKHIAVPLTTIFNISDVVYKIFKPTLPRRLNLSPEQCDVVMKRLGTIVSVLMVALFMCSISLDFFF